MVTKPFKVSAFNDKGAYCFKKSEEQFVSLSKAAERAEEMMNNPNVDSISLTAFYGNILLIKWSRDDGWTSDS